MATQSKRLPSRFPVGTKFVLEDRRVGRSRRYARYIVFPDGRHVDVPAVTMKADVKPARRRARR